MSDTTDPQEPIDSLDIGLDSDGPDSDEAKPPSEPAASGHAKPPSEPKPASEPAASGDGDLDVGDEAEAPTVNLRSQRDARPSAEPGAASLDDEASSDARGPDTPDSDARLEADESESEDPEAAQSPPPQTCLSCGETSPPDASWCEACGADLDAEPPAPKNPCVSCGADGAEITDDGWCQMCGTKQPAPEDHVVDDRGWFAVVSDKGKIHRSNEDAGAVAQRNDGIVLVVCDGVSSTEGSERASQNAARKVAEILQTPSFGAVEGAMVVAATNAQSEIIAAAPEASDEPPSCTLVAAVARVVDDEIHMRIGWLGDSRAYWVADGTAMPLTRDHSWALEQEELGELDADTIAADPRAHSITRWLGADSPDVTPEYRAIDLALDVDRPGLLVVCSDGLWNYAQTDSEMHDVVMAGPDDEGALDRAERLVAFANERGGHDNITVAIADFLHRDLSDPDPQGSTDD